MGEGWRGPCRVASSWSSIFGAYIHMDTWALVLVLGPLHSRGRPGRTYLVPGSDLPSSGHRGRLKNQWMKISRSDLQRLERQTAKAELIQRQKFLWVPRPWLILHCPPMYVSLFLSVPHHSSLECCHLITFRRPPVKVSS